MISPLLNNVVGSSTALNTSVQGAQKEAANFAKAADNLQKGFAENANAVSAAPENKLEASTALASQEVPDVVTSSVDMLKSENAFKANLEAFKAAADLEEEIINVLKRDV